MTASVWITRSYEYLIYTASGPLEQVSTTQAHSLWQVFAVVNRSYIAPFALGALVIVAFALVALVVRRRPGVVLALAAASAVTTLIIMVLADADYVPGPGAWMTLLVSVAVVGAALDELVRRPAASSD